MRNSATDKDISYLDHNNISNLYREDIYGLDPERKILTYGQIKLNHEWSLRFQPFVIQGFYEFSLKIQRYS